MVKRSKRGAAKTPPPDETEDETRRMRIAAALRELQDKYNRITPEIVVEAASNPANPLNGEFEWDDRKAAYKQRLDRARKLITYITVVVVHKNEKMIVPYYVRDPAAPPKRQGYVSLGSSSLKREDARTIMLAEFDRCEASIKRARGVTGVLDKRFPGLDEQLEKLLARILEMRQVLDEVD